jgi:hypothetical protein
MGCGAVSHHPENLLCCSEERRPLDSNFAWYYDEHHDGVMLDVMRDVMS